MAHEPCTNYQIKEILDRDLETNQVLKRSKYFELDYRTYPTTIGCILVPIGQLQKAESSR